MAKFTFLALTFVLLTISLITETAFANSTTEGAFPQGTSPQRDFLISQWNGTNWEALYQYEFSVEYSTAKFAISPVNGNVSLRIVQTGVPFADVDQAKLVTCNQELIPDYARYTENNQSILEDILEIDLDVVVAHEQEIEISWQIPDECDTVIFALHANEYGHGTPFQFPLTGFISYQMGSNPESITVDGIIDETDGTVPLYSPFWEPATGHPDGFTYIYVCDDSDNVYFSIDATCDNTSEFGQDWAEIVVLASDGTEHEFRVDDFNSIWGRSSFGVTSKVIYKHKTYEFALPKSIIGNDDIEFKLKYYGTTAGVDLAITKSDSADPVIAGNPLTYTVTVLNLSAIDALNVVVTDTLPPGVTFISTSGAAEDPNGVPTANLGTITASASKQFTITVNVNSSTSGTITNTASVESSSSDVNPLNNLISEDTTVNAQADLDISKSDSPDPVVAGSQLTYTITVQNLGPSDAQNVVVTDTLPPGVSNPVTSGAAEDPNGVPTASLGTIAAGDSRQYTITVDVDFGTSGTITNTAIVNSLTPDPNPNNNPGVQGTYVDQQTAGQYGGWYSPTVGGQVMMINRSVVFNRCIALPIWFMIGILF